MKIPPILTSIVGEVKQSGIVASVFNFFQGRATFFAIVFSGVGIWLAVYGKLDANYSMFVGAIQSMVLAHSWKEDIHEQRMAMMEKRGGADLECPKQQL